MIFHYSKLLLIYIGINCLLPSCSRYIGTVDGNKIKRKVFIRITGVVPNTTKLILKDEQGNSADTFNAYSGQKVVWEIEDKADIKSIRNYPKESSLKSPDIYKNGPKRRFLSKNLKAKMIETKEVLEEHYNIDWTDKGGTLQHYDPLMQLNPIK